MRDFFQESSVSYSADIPPLGLIAPLLQQNRFDWLSFQGIVNCQCVYVSFRSPVMLNLVKMAIRSNYLVLLFFGAYELNLQKYVLGLN